MRDASPQGSTHGVAHAEELANMSCKPHVRGARHGAVSAALEREMGSSSELVMRPVKCNGRLLRGGGNLTAVGPHRLRHILQSRRGPRQGLCRVHPLPNALPARAPDLTLLHLLHLDKQLSEALGLHLGRAKRPVQVYAYVWFNYADGSRPSTRATTTSYNATRSSVFGTVLLPRPPARYQRLPDLGWRPWYGSGPRDSSLTKVAAGTHDVTNLAVGDLLEGPADNDTSTTVVVCAAHGNCYPVCGGWVFLDALKASRQVTTVVLVSLTRCQQDLPTSRRQQGS